MSSYRNIQEQSGAVPDSKKQYVSPTGHVKYMWNMPMNVHNGTCKQSGCRNTFLNQEGYCFPHHTARNTEGMFTNEESSMSDDQWENYNRIKPFKLLY